MKRKVGGGVVVGGASDGGKWQLLMGPGLDGFMIDGPAIQRLADAAGVSVGNAVISDALDCALYGSKDVRGRGRGRASFRQKMAAIDKERAGASSHDGDFSGIQCDLSLFVNHCRIQVSALQQAPSLLNKLRREEELLELKIAQLEEISSTSGS